MLSSFYMLFLLLFLIFFVVLVLVVIFIYNPLKKITAGLRNTLPEISAIPSLSAPEMKWIPGSDSELYVRGTEAHR